MNTTPFDSILSRRGMMGNVFSGLAGLGLTSLMQRDLLAASDWKPGLGATHFKRKPLSNGV